MNYSDGNKETSVSIIKGNSFFLDSRKNPIISSGVRRRSSWPKIFSCFFGRLIRHKWYLQEYFTSERYEHSIYVNTCEGKRIILFELQKNDKLAFDMKYLLGFSSSISLCTVVDLALTGYAVQRNFIHIAYGPGIILFETNGKPELIDNKTSHCDPNSIFSPHRMIAWSPSMDFRFDSIYRWCDIFLSNVRIQCRTRQNEVVLLDADKSPSSHQNIFVKIMKDCYWPFRSI